MSQTDWRPSASRKALVHRAQLFAKVRQFFAERDVLEVDTPVLSQGTASEPGLASFQLAQKDNRWLITSPEFAMKRLLAADSGPIYRLGPAFRADEAGRWHNPEFCMLEWYRPGLDYRQLMDEVSALLQFVLSDSLELSVNISRHTVASVFQQCVELDPHTANVEQLKNAAEQRGWAPDNHDSPGDAGHDFWLDLILAMGVANHLADAGPCFIYDYPARMAMLTQTSQGVDSDHIAVAERFELYWHGVELANGGNELLDAELVQRRFKLDQAQRRVDGKDTQVGDARLLAAQQHGLPACAGVALGVDRLLALALGLDAIEPVLPFAWTRA